MEGTPAYRASGAAMVRIQPRMDNARPPSLRYSLLQNCTTVLRSPVGSILTGWMTVLAFVDHV